MHKTGQRLIILMAWLVGMAAMPVLADKVEYDEGIEYQLVVPEQATVDANKIEVLEIFWYGCPHCHRLEPLLEEWVKQQKDDVVFVRLPALLNPKWDVFVRAYYTAQLLGVLERMHRPLFDAIHLKKQNLNSEAALARFFAKFGVDEDLFHKTYNSFGVMTKLNQARQMTRRYGISGVPTMVVNGKYKTSARLTGGHRGMLKAVDYLVEMERQKK